MSEQSDPAKATTSSASGGQDGPSDTDGGTARLLNLPNQITLSRLVLSLIFFVLLILDDYGFLGQSRRLVLNLSIVLFGLAAITDFLDGYLARRWKQVSTFGRLADPIVDKVFICGSFVLLIPISSLIHTWIPVILLAREFLVSGLRSFVESLGIPFGADLGGKLKMGVQSVTIPVVIFYEANFQGSAAWRWVASLLVAATIVLTITSSIGYARKAYVLLRRPR